MKPEEQLKEILEQTSLPVKEYEYKGTEEEYIVFNEEDERGGYFGDNTVEVFSTTWQVHIYAHRKSNFRKRKREVRRLLLKNGFCIQNIDTLPEKETDTMHVIISCSIEEMEEE